MSTRRNFLKGKIFFLFHLLFLGIFLFSPFFSFAFAADKPLEVNYPAINGIQPTSSTALPDYIKYIFYLSLYLAGFIALAVLVYAGFSYLTSAGNPVKAKEAKGRIYSAITGIAILFCSYLILNTINPQLTFFQLPVLPANSPLPAPAQTLTNPAKVYSIDEELPIGQAITGNLWLASKIATTDGLLTNLETFLNTETKMNDPSVGDDKFGRVSDLIKYIQYKASECQCGNLTGLCEKPSTGSGKVGCEGDPCQKQQSQLPGGGVEPGSSREKMQQAESLAREKIKTLTDFQARIDARDRTNRDDLRKFQELEGEFIACQQNQELTSLNQYLADQQSSADSGLQNQKITSYVESKGNPLTFYCSSGGNAADQSQQWGINSNETENSAPSEISNESDIATDIVKTSCPYELPVGNVIDELRELSAVMDIKLQRISNLISSLAEESEKMFELASQCNSKQCDISCNAFPNPCYEKCSPLTAWCCKPKNLQNIGGCSGDPCPIAAMADQSIVVKNIEDKIFESISQIKEIFPRVNYLLSGKNNPQNLNNLETSVGLCYSSDFENPTWNLSDCETAKGNYGPSGSLMTSCRPRNLFCCSDTGASSLDISSSPVNNDLYYITQNQKLPLLAEENNCPKGWACSDNVKKYDQYQKYASDPLKQMLSCMRPKLDAIQKQNNETDVIGNIFLISDPGIDKKTCDWETGQTNPPSGCLFPYETSHGKQKISAHYGGSACNWQQKSYAVDFDLSGDYQKKYVEQIIKAAKACAVQPYILDEVSSLHIDIGQENNCQTND